MVVVGAAIHVDQFDGIEMLVPGEPFGRDAETEHAQPRRRRIAPVAIARFAERVVTTAVDQRIGRTVDDRIDTTQTIFE